MVLPRGLARFNRVVTNRATGVLAPRLPGMGIVVHQGRRSGRTYRTPVNVFRRDGGFVVALTYGADSQWVRNVLAAGEAEIVTGGEAHSMVNPRIVVDASCAAVPRLVRPVLRRLGVHEMLFLDAT